MRLTLALDPSFTVEFTQVGDLVGPYPWLIDVGTLRLSARAGHLSGIGIGESPSLPVSIDNAGKQATKILGQPSRVRAEVFDDNNKLFFAGYVSGASYGRSIDLTIEA